MRRKSHKPSQFDSVDLDALDLDTPLRLADAARLAFPDGSITAPALRREAQRGTLVVEIIAGKMFTTLAHIKEMRRLCRVQAKVPAFISNPSVAPETEVSGSDPVGSSATDQETSAQDALRRKLEKLNAS
jgi:hypothetical protein